VNHLRELGIEAQATSPIAGLIEKVWELQRPFLVHLKVERRRSPRRQMPPGYALDLVLSSAVSRLRQRH
jgi:hypothetical protein